ncbi:type IV pilin-like G/H family protein [Roseofilum casamattae]|uniref:Type IV pilin-like G/H family protein n=1 Tax=Roseofilum casamattae BLCC-M143 TaxID=3022442 RepID=A0ABT7BSM9_9CYAN|nr:type IV pilin-like G/H family protein [Roseofilum casamattae]MDJ1182185.1 type IV pilin-like G/H family protein [Roseofilum casamattae BLCC-M143]
MKTEFRTKFLQHLIDKKENEGFTLIELLVVIIIIGVLSAIALPSFLNQANKAKQSEAKTYVGSLNRSQQTHYAERGFFTNTIAALGLGIKTETKNFEYGMTVGGDNSNITSSSAVTNYAAATRDALKSYIGGVSIAVVGENDGTEATTLSVLCESNTPRQTVANTNFSDRNSTGPYCPAGDWIDLS